MVPVLLIMNPPLLSRRPLFAPAAIAMVNYMVAGRLLSASGKRIGWFEPAYISRFFLGSDIACLFLQGGAGGMMGSAAENPAMAEQGMNLMLFGLALQLGFFSLFALVTRRLQTAPQYGLHNLLTAPTIFRVIYGFK